ncbi:unnamed protein product [Rhizoctonia solani]|uniref:Uncharacterized protein n=1 Tax=Rhizoctonia solani TaxID=456999 RepID=A0A8H3AUP6_9AGAM|nr:unnamed protein product [Rhizoctonia solani]
MASTFQASILVAAAFWGAAKVDLMWTTLHVGVPRFFGRLCSSHMTCATPPADRRHSNVDFNAAAMIYGAFELDRFVGSDSGGAIRPRRCFFLFNARPGDLSIVLPNSTRLSLNLFFVVLEIMKTTWFLRFRLHLSSNHAFTDHQDNSQRPGSKLFGSLRGILPEVQCHAALATYPGRAWSDGSDMSISPACVTPDALRITDWTRRFNRGALMGYHDIPNPCGRKNATPEPSAGNMRKIFEEPRGLPTLIYMSGHTDSVGGERF